MKGLTHPQKTALDWIKNFIKDNGFSPTGVEVSQGLGVSYPASQKRIKGLKKKGFISSRQGVARSIVVNDIKDTEHQANKWRLP